MYDSDNDPEYDEYDDDEYRQYPEYNEYGYPQQFKFDWSAWELWLKDALNDIIQESDNTWVFGHYSNDENQKENQSETDKAIEKYFAYLGKNNYDEAVWKTKYFISSKLQNEYKNHIIANAVHFLKQPSYYKGMFDNLN